MNTLLIKNVDILPCDGSGRTIKNGCMAVDNGKITYLGLGPVDGSFDRVIDGKGKILMPGLINAHAHVPMTGLRGYADDLALQTWLNDHIFPVEDRMDANCVRISAELGMAEMLASGTTSFSDMYSFCDDIAEAVANNGMKANICRGILCFDDSVPFDTANNLRWAESVGLYDRWHGYDNGRILIDFCVHAEYTTTKRCRETVARYAAEKEAIVHFHLSETQSEHEACLARHGKTPARLFYEEGLLTNRALAAHCVWLSEDDIKLFSEVGASVGHCPVSNLKLASGIAPVTAMVDAGVNVALGTDGVASNNNHDLFEEIKLASLLQKGVTLRPEVFPADAALIMATKNGAKAQGRRECGSLFVGGDADFILLDTSAPNMTPRHHAASTAAYSARGSEVCLTAVRGKILYENGELKTIDREKLLAEFEKLVRPVMFPA